MRLLSNAAPARLALAGCLLALAACGGTPRVGNIPSVQKGAVSDWPVKIGNPYQVLGQWYYPKDERDYDERGIASWYGPNFHGLNTANGERYDMEMFSAAHKTLPLPSYVEVTNLDNGRKLIVRVNDRGPFVSDRVIDLSRRSAEYLGVMRPGTARVRVRRVYPSEDVKLALRTGRADDRVQVAALAAAPSPPGPAPLSSPMVASAPQALPPSAGVTSAVEGVTMVSLPPSTAGISAAARPASPPLSTSVPPARMSFASPVPSFIQVAAVSDPGKASWLAGFLKAYGTTVMQPTANGLIRVRIGPFASSADAEAALAKVRSAGYQDARIVTDAPVG